MSKKQVAPFDFLDYAITKYLYNELDNPDTKLKLNFTPSGKYNSKSGTFNINLIFTATDEKIKQKEPVIKLTMKAIFKFENGVKFDDIPEYFYSSCMAIIFPYIRAFVSNMALMANSKMLLLEPMNLTGLSKPLKENIEVVND